MTIYLPEPRLTPHGTVRAAPFETTQVLPKETDTVVIGGGINGVMTAYWLAQRGVRVTLLEKGEIAGESSSRAFGWVSDLLLDPVKMELCARTKNHWAHLQESIGELGYRQHGIAFMANSADEMDFFAGWKSEIGADRTDVALLTSEQVASKYPSRKTKVPGAIHCSTDGGAEPRLAAVAVARAARELGAEIITNCAARGLDIQNGRAVGVFTEKGLLKCDNVVFAGNLWSRLFCGNFGVSVPQLYAVSSLCRTGPVSNGPIGAGGRFEGAWRAHIDGTYSIGRLLGQHAPITRDSIQLFGQFLPALKAEWHSLKLSFDADARQDWRRPRRWTMDEVSPFECERVLQNVVDRTIGEKGWKELKQHFDCFKDCEILEHWAGPITITPDNLPIASAVDGVANFYLLTGCAYGFTWAPALAEVIADLVQGRKPAIDHSLFRLSRFTDGTKLRLTM